MASKGACEENVKSRSLTELSFQPQTLHGCGACLRVLFVDDLQPRGRRVPHGIVSTMSISPI